MPELTDILDITFEELSEDHQLMLKTAADQFIKKRLLSFAKNRSGAPFLKSDLPRVLLPGQSDLAENEEREKFSGLLYKALGKTMTNHNAAFLNSFRHIMVSIFGQHVDKPFEQAHGQLGGPTYFNVQTSVQKPHGKGTVEETGASGTKDVDGLPIQQDLQQAMPNPRTYGDMAFGTTGNPPASAYKISPLNNRLQRNMYGEGYSEFMDYNAINALPNPGYGGVAGTPAGRPGNQYPNVDLLVHKMTDVLQNQFGLKPKNQGYMYSSPFPEWYQRVSLPNRVKISIEFTKFSGQDDTSSVEHIARFLMQLGEASADEAFRIRYFPLSLTGLAFTWFASLPAQSICTWKDLEQKFHAHYYTGSTEKKLVDLTSLRQRNNETPTEFLRRFRETKSMCFSLNIPDDQLAGMAVAGMLPAIREKLFGIEFDDLGQLSHRLALMSNQAYGFKKDVRFAKHNDIADIYNQFLEKADREDEYEDEEEIAAAEIVWGKEPVTVNQRWIKHTKGTYDFDVTKEDKLFDFLVKEGRIKLPEGHSMLRPDGVKDKKYCGFHDRNSHSINECRVFRVRIQKAIQEGHLKFDNKIKLDSNPFPQNMIGFSINMVNAVEPEEKGKVKVLTSTKARQDGSVDPTRQVMIEQMHKKEPRFPNSQVEVGESSKPRVTSRILLNKWQRQQEKARYRGTSTKRRSEDMKKKGIGKNKKNICENKSVCIGDVPSSDTVGTRV